MNKQALLGVLKMWGILLAYAAYFTILTIGTLRYGVIAPVLLLVLPGFFLFSLYIYYDEVARNSK